jgi:hypothetical protein
VRSTAAAGKVERADLVYLAHAAYRVSLARDVVALLRYARPGTLLLVRYTADASLYRAISVSTACAPIRPYDYHAIHPLMLRDLLRGGWKSRWRAVLEKHADISRPENRAQIVDWCDAEYGEFSGDIIERYLRGFAACGYECVPNYDYLELLEKAWLTSSPSNPLAPDYHVRT